MVGAILIIIACFGAQVAGFHIVLRACTVALGCHCGLAADVATMTATSSGSAASREVVFAVVQIAAIAFPHHASARPPRHLALWSSAVAVTSLRALVVGRHVVVAELLTATTWAAPEVS